MDRQIALITEGVAVSLLTRKSIYIFSDLNERAAMKAKALTHAAAVIPGEPVGPYHAHRGASLRSR